MRAMVLHEQNEIENSPLRLEEVEIPQPGPGQIRIRVEACGLCRTDLQAAPLLCAGLIGYRAFCMAGDGHRLGFYAFGA